MQTWPQFWKLPAMAPSTATSRSASSSTMFADLPPSSSDTCLSVPAASDMMRLPTSLLPVSDTLSTLGCRHSASPSEPPGPVMTLSTPFGMPAWLASAAIISADSGVVDAGLSTTVLPVTRACAIFHSAIM